MSWQECKCLKVIDNVITMIKLQEPMEKRFFVNYVQKTTKQEKPFEAIERNFSKKSMEVHKLRYVT